MDGEVNSLQGAHLLRKPRECPSIALKVPLCSGLSIGNPTEKARASLPLQESPCRSTVRVIPSIGNQPTPYRGLLGLRAPNPKKVSGPRDPKKVSKSLGDSPGSLRRVSRKCLESVFGLSPGLFGDFLGPRETFSDFFGISGPEGPRDLCKGRAGSQSECS